MPADRGGGRAVLTVRWPARGRLIPLAANSLVVSVSENGAVVGRALIARPASGSNVTTATLTGLPYGDLPVMVQAYPNADGTGVAQASGAGTMHVTEDTAGSLSVALDSTVASLTVSPASPLVAVGDTLGLTASAKDRDGNVVLLAAGGGSETIAWSVDDSSVATVTGTGPTATLKGIADGSTAVHASLRVKDDGTTVGGDANVRATTRTLTLSAPAWCVFGITSPIFGAVNKNRFTLTATLSPAASTGASVPVAIQGPATGYGPSLTFGANSTSATLSGIVTQVETDTQVTFTATYGSLPPATTTMTVKPNPLDSVTGSATLASGAQGTGTVNLGYYALAAEDVALSCDDSTVVLPPKVTIPAPVYHPPQDCTVECSGYTTYSKSVGFSFTAPTVTTARTVTITATRGGVSQNFAVTINP